MSSNQSIAYPNIALNVAVTESLDYMATELEKAHRRRQDARRGGRRAAAEGDQGEQADHLQRQRLLEGVGEGGGKRGLLNLKNTVDALPQLVSKETIALFEKYKVLNERELHARYEIMIETYNKTVNVEGQLMVLMANRYILPAALEYQKQIARERRGGEVGRRQVGRRARSCSTQFTKLVDELKRRSDKLAAALEHEGNGDAERHAKHYRDVVIPAMHALRDAGDTIEVMMPHETWPLATYREMLFIK